MTPNQTTKIDELLKLLKPEFSEINLFAVGECPKCGQISPFAYANVEIPFQYCLNCHKPSNPVKVLGYANEDDLDITDWRCEI
jgi:hypothetical protein